MQDTPPTTGSAGATVPIGHRTINPYLTVKDVPALLEFLQRTFDAVLIEQIRQPNGAIAHTEVRIGDSLLMVGAPEIDEPQPHRAEVRPGTFYVYVPSVDATYERAMTAGANSWEPPTDRFYGDRVAAVVDTNDNVWWIATRQHTFTQQEVQTRADQRWRNGEHTF